MVDGLYFASNLTKVPDGGWFPLLVAAIAFTLLTTWAKGRKLMRARLGEDAMSVELFIQSALNRLERVSGTAVFLSSTQDGVPPALLHNAKHNKVLHERVIVVTVKVAKVPHVPPAERAELSHPSHGFYRVTLHYGFTDEVDLPAALMAIAWDKPLRTPDTSYFLGRQTLIASSRPGMALWREKLFAWMVQNAESAMDFFKLPVNRVVELGSQLEI